MHGKGVFQNIEGDKYYGDYIDGKRHGMCIFKYKEGDNYFGEY